MTPSRRTAGIRAGRAGGGQRKVGDDGRVGEEVREEGEVVVAGAGDAVDGFGEEEDEDPDGEDDAEGAGQAAVEHLGGLEVDMCTS